MDRKRIAGEIRSTKVYGNDFWRFYYKQSEKVQEKIDWTIKVVRETSFVPEIYLKHIEGTNGIYEIRVGFGNNIFRIFCLFDEGSLVILLNGFQKKDQKTPRKEIEKGKKTFKTIS